MRPLTALLFLPLSVVASSPQASAVTNVTVTLGTSSEYGVTLSRSGSRSEPLSSRSRTVELFHTTSRSALPRPVLRRRTAASATRHRR